MGNEAGIPGETEWNPTSSTRSRGGDSVTSTRSRARTVAPTPLDQLGPEFDFVTPEHRTPTLFGRFTELRVLGSGTTARVLAVEDPNTKLRYAIKEMTRSVALNEKLFLREADILRRVFHDNVVTYHTCYVDNDHFYILTDLCTGGMLLDRVEGMDDFCEKSAANIFRQVLNGIQFLHEHDIAHRDIKPENICFAHPGQDAQVILVDMGSASIMNHIEKYDDWIGSPAYMAPENLRERTAEEVLLSDLWGLGVTAYYLLVGEHPFWGNDLKSLFIEIARKKVRFSSDSKLTEPCRKFIRGLMRRSTDRRLSARDALDHPWIIDRRKQSDDHLRHWGDHIANYRNASAFKKLIVNSAIRAMPSEQKANLDETFDHIDLDQNGYIDEHELTQYLIHRGLEPEKAKARAFVWIDEMDGDEDRAITKLEFLQAHWAEQVARDDFLEAAFAKMDSNGSGRVGLEEVKAAIEQLIRRPVRFEEAEAFLKEIDVSGNGYLTFRDFRAGLKALSEKQERRFTRMVSDDEQALLPEDERQAAVAGGLGAISEE